MFFACRELSKDFYQNWTKSNREALKCSDRSERDKLVSDSYEAIEKDLSLLGAAALEDRLEEVSFYFLQNVISCFLVMQ